MYCISNYRIGDDRDSRSPDYVEPPEGAFYEEDHAVDFIFDTTSITSYEEALELIYYDRDNDLYWLEEEHYEHRLHADEHGHGSRQ